MKYLLDTNVISELRKPKPHVGVMNWVAALSPTDLAVCSFTFGELQNGVELTRKQDPGKAVEIERWLDELQITIPILDLDAEAFRRWARIMVGKPAQLREDGLIAAVALCRGLTVATRNVKDFAPFDVEVLNPFGT